MNPKNKILITGTSRGLGKSLAENYLAKGHLVFGCSRGDASIEHGSYRHFSLDLQDSDSRKEMFRSIRKESKTLDIAIMNAGIEDSALVLMMEDETIQKLFQINVAASIACARESVRLMRKNGEGLILFLSSIHVPLASEGAALYSSSKAALEQFSRVLAREVRSFGIRSNCMGLSFVENTSMNELFTDEQRAKYLSQLNHQECLNLQEVVHTIDFLKDPLSRSISGQTIYLGSPVSR